MFQNKYWDDSNECNWKANWFVHFVTQMKTNTYIIKKNNRAQILGEITIFCCDLQEAMKQMMHSDYKTQSFLRSAHS
jgi:hypothetical protein